MDWLRLPDGFLRLSGSLRNELEAFLTDLQLKWLQIAPDDREHYRFSQITIPALCGFLWAAYRDAASGPGRRISDIALHFNTFRDTNRHHLFGEWPPEPIMTVIVEQPWFRELLEWQKFVHQRESNTFTGVFPDITRRPIAMSPASNAAYPYPLWKGTTPREVQSPEDEDAARAEAWHPYGEPDVELKPTQPVVDSAATTPLSIPEADARSLTPSTITFAADQQSPDQASTPPPSTAEDAASGSGTPAPQTNDVPADRARLPPLETENERRAAVKEKLARVSKELELFPPLKHDTEFWKVGPYSDRGAFEDWIKTGRPKSADDAFRGVLAEDSPTYYRRLQSWPERRKIAEQKKT